jgi:hypothetical protein
MRIRGSGWKKFGSEIRDKHPWYYQVREVQEEMRSARLEAHIKQLTKVRVHIPVHIFVNLAGR